MSVLAIFRKIGDDHPTVPNVPLLLSIEYTRWPHPLTPMMPYAPETPHECWFCSCNNLSYASECARCGGLTLPTRNKNERKLCWTIWTAPIGASTLSASEGAKNAASHSSAVESSDLPELTAIRLIEDGKKQFLLARYPQKGKRYSVRREDGTVETGNWDESSDKNWTHYLRVVHEILAGRTKELSRK